LSSHLIFVSLPSFPSLPHPHPLPWQSQFSLVFLQTDTEPVKVNNVHSPPPSSFKDKQKNGFLAIAKYIYECNGGNTFCNLLSRYSSPSRDCVTFRPSITLSS
jgi:hypothetical protein